MKLICIQYTKALKKSLHRNNYPRVQAVNFYEFEICFKDTPLNYPVAEYENLIAQLCCASKYTKGEKFHGINGNKTCTFGFEQFFLLKT